MAVSRRYFGEGPNHISQSRLLSIEFEQLKDKGRVQFGQEIHEITKSEGVYLLRNQVGKVVARSKYVILANGFHSGLREKLGISVGGGREFFGLVNVHFRSRRLGEMIRERGCEAMLHFVYNERVPCVLVSHSLAEGEFVLQVPNYEPFVDLLAVYTPQQLL